MGKEQLSLKKNINKRIDCFQPFGLCSFPATYRCYLFPLHTDFLPLAGTWLSTVRDFHVILWWAREWFLCSRFQDKKFLRRPVTSRKGGLPWLTWLWLVFWEKLASSHGQEATVWGSDVPGSGDVKWPVYADTNPHARAHHAHCDSGNAILKWVAQYLTWTQHFLRERRSVSLLGIPVGAFLTRPAWIAWVVEGQQM